MPAFAAMNADPRVMEFMPKTLTREESDAFVTRIQDHFAHNGFGLWAVEVQGIAPFIGFVGLNIPTFTAAFTPCVEVGWRLAYDHWGHGYATEAARAAVDFGFNTLGLKEIVAMTVPANQRSQRVMNRLGMTYSTADDFDHPNLAADHPLRRHILYRLAREQWLACQR
jgi:RimJ/RimL family protein N-acetyltransferase